MPLTGMSGSFLDYHPVRNAEKPLSSGAGDLRDQALRKGGCVGHGMSRLSLQDNVLLTRALRVCDLRRLDRLGVVVVVVVAVVSRRLLINIAIDSKKTSQVSSQSASWAYSHSSSPLWIDLREGLLSGSGAAMYTLRRSGQRGSFPQVPSS